MQVVTTRCLSLWQSPSKSVFLSVSLPPLPLSFAPSLSLTHSLSLSLFLSLSLSLTHSLSLSRSLSLCLSLSLSSSLLPSLSLPLSVSLSLCLAPYLPPCFGFSTSRTSCGCGGALEKSDEGNRRIATNSAIAAFVLEGRRCSAMAPRSYSFAWQGRG